MKDKINPIAFKVHPKFKNLVVLLQTARINKGKETSLNKIALWRLTKTISNLLESNETLWKSLIEVDIDVKY